MPACVPTGRDYGGQRPVRARKPALGENGLDISAGRGIIEGEEGMPVLSRWGAYAVWGRPLERRI